jgi:hypothetical protein
MLERRATGSPWTGFRIVSKGSARLGNWVELPAVRDGESQFLDLRLYRRLPGALAAAFFRTGEMALDLRYDDRPRDPLRFRVLPTLLHDLRIDHAPRTIGELEALFDQRPVATVRGFRLVGPRTRGVDARFEYVIHAAKLSPGNRPQR